VARRRAVFVLCIGSAIVVTACATKGFVRDQVRSSDERVVDQFERQDAKLREITQGAAATRDDIAAADQRLEDVGTRVGQADTAATEAQNKATEAQNRAEEAAAAARDAEARLSQRLADRNKYRLVQTRSIYFDSDRADIRDAGVHELEEVANELQADPNALVELQGFADPQGSEGYNDELARKRVEGVIRHLVQRHGTELRQIRSLAMGRVALAAGQKPTPDVLAEARRVEIRVVAPWSSWEDKQADLDPERSSPSASPPMDLDSPTQPGRRDGGFSPDDAERLLRVLEEKRRARPGTLREP
jgi:outer membrane protein OmpA-like peptidoglycan-associated protein